MRVEEEKYIECTLKLFLIKRMSYEFTSILVAFHQEDFIEMWNID